MKKRHFYKFLSFLMAVVFLFNMLLMCVNATPEEIAPQLQEQPREAMIIGSPDFDEEFEDISSLKELGPGEKPLEELREMTLDSNALPQFLSYGEAVSKGHVNRLYEQENDLSTIIYQNKDGGKTAYMFAKNIKYVDADGNIKDKSTKIGATQAKGYSYAMEQNNIKAYFPQQSTAGIKLTHNGYEISMKPKESAEKVSVTFNSSENKIVYAEVFGSNTFLVYEPFMEGVKEDIVLAKYTGQNEFEFILTAEGLTASKINEVWYLVDSNGEAVARFEDIIIKDSNGKTVEGALDIAQQSDGTYEITVTADEEFLTAPDTSYPVYIDPTTYILETEQYLIDGLETTLPSLIDVGVYDTMTSPASSDSSFHYIGTHDGTQGRIIYKFTDFFNYGVGNFTELNQYQISSVQLNLRVVSAEQSATLSVYQLLTTWDETSFGSNPSFLNDATEYWDSSNYVLTGTTDIYPAFEEYFSLDITSIVKNWAKFNNGDSILESNNPAYGFMIACNDEYEHMIEACETTSEIDDVYAIIDYSNTGGEYFIYNYSDYDFLESYSSAVISGNYEDSDFQKWVVEYIGNDKYYIHSAYNDNYSLCGSGSSLSVALRPANPGNQYKWYIYPVSGGGVFVKNVASGNVLSCNGTSVSLVSTPAEGTEAYENCRFAYLLTDYCVPLTDFTLSDFWIPHGTPEQPTSKYLNLITTPSNASWQGASFFTWESDNSACVSVSPTIPSLIEANSNGSATITVTHKITGISRQFVVTCGSVRDGSYVLMNRNTSRYLYSPSTTSGDYVCQWSYGNTDLYKWEFTRQTDGYYTIKNSNSGCYLGMQGHSTASGTNAVQMARDNARTTRWSIYYTENGTYKLSAKGSPSLALTVPLNNISDGTHLTQETYTNNAQYNDEWFLFIAEEHPNIVGSAYCNIKNVNSQKHIYVSGCETDNGSDVIQCSILASPEKLLWMFEHQSNGEYMIKDLNSGKYLSVSGSSSVANANIHIWENDGTTGLIFRISENPDGSYSFFSKASGFTRLVGIPNSSTATGASVKQVDFTSSNSTKFNISATKVLVYICASGFTEENSSAGSFGGHAWLEVINVSSQPITIGDYENLQPGEQISVGLFGSASGSDYADGVWYNRESYEHHINNKYSLIAKYPTLISMDEVNKFSIIAKKCRNAYDFKLFNCTTFAVIVWNHFDSLKFYGYNIPQHLFEEMLFVSGTELDTHIFYAEHFYHHDGTRIYQFNNSTEAN